MKTRYLQSVGDLTIVLEYESDSEELVLIGSYTSYEEALRIAEDLLSQKEYIESRLLSLSDKIDELETPKVKDAADKLHPSWNDPDRGWI